MEPASVRAKKPNLGTEQIQATSAGATFTGCDFFLQSFEGSGTLDHGKRQLQHISANFTTS